VERDAHERVLAALRRGLELGATHIDTAEMYGSGRVEELVGEAVAGRRDEVFLVSKVLPSNATRRGVLEACERSLERLGTDRLDLYLLHWPSEHPLEETIAGFEELAQAGKVLAYGVSNFDASELAEAVAIAGEGRIACDQVLYHVEERAAEHRVQPYCLERGIALVAYSPLGSGRFPAGRQAAVLEAIGRARGATARQVALAFLLRHHNGFAIPKSSRLEHVEDNVAAADLELDAEAIRLIDEALPRGAEPASLPVI